MKEKLFLAYVLVGLSFIVSARSSTAQSSSQPLTSSKCNEFTFDGTGSFDQEGGPLSYEWNLGDGTVVNEPTTVHTYEKAGLYTVTLTIKDEEGLSSRSQQKVLVNLPPIVNLLAPDKVCVNEGFRMDASASIDDSHKKLKYSWDFGDGTDAGDKDNVVKIYNKGGNLKVRLTADDQSGQICSSKTIEHTIKVNEPPKADAGPSEIFKCVPKGEALTVDFDAGTTYDINSDTLSYEWDFGDGAMGKGQTTEHTYKDYDVYDVKLMVNDNSQMECASSIDFVKVQINDAVKADAGNDIVACLGEPIVLDGSKSYTNPPGTSMGKWDFGDGTSGKGIEVSHTYTKPGKYEAQLTIESRLNADCPASTDTRAVQVNSPPTVTLKAPEIHCVGEEISFEASAQDNEDTELEYYWSFGDGLILRGGNKVSHKYETGGTYKVSVIVDDKRESACSTATATQTIKINTPPKADTGVNQSCCVDVAAEFDGSASYDPDGDSLSFTWDFGDGETSDMPIPTHTYKAPKEFTVKLTVNDNVGSACSVASESFTTKINTTPVPVIKVQ